MLSTAVGALTSPFAQTSRRVPRVVFQGFGPIVPGDNETVFGPFRNGLRELGYVEGSTIVLELHHVDRKPERLPAALHELVQQGVDVIICGQPQIALAAMRATQTTPIVFAAIIDPVGAGIVQSLAKPGGNATGLSWDAEPEIAAKQLQMLRELVPGRRNLALLWNPDVAGSAAFVRPAQCRTCRRERNRLGPPIDCRGGQCSLGPPSGRHAAGIHGRSARSLSIPPSPGRE